MHTRICTQCKGEFTPVPVKVRTLIACPHFLRGCGTTWWEDGKMHWYPKTYWQLPEDD
jgi:hypothetical protein